MAISNKGEGAGLEEAGPVLLRGCMATGDVAPLPASSGTAWHSRQLLCRAGDTGSQLGASASTMHAAMQGVHVVPRSWVMHGCKALHGTRWSWTR